MAPRLSFSGLGGGGDGYRGFGKSLGDINATLTGIQDRELKAREFEANRLLKEKKLTDTADYRGRTIGLQEARDKYTRDVAEGEVAGQGLNLTEMVKGTKTANVLDKDVLAQDFAEKVATIGGTEAENQQAWIDYQIANDPQYTDPDSVLKKSADFIRSVPSPVEAVKEYITDPFMQATTATPRSRDEAALAELQKVKPTAPQSREEFMAGLDKGNVEAKAALKEFVKTDEGYQKAIGALTPQSTPTMVRATSEALHSEVDHNIAAEQTAYKERTGKAMPKDMVTGLKKGGYAKVDSLLKSRTTTDIEKFKAGNKLQQEQRKAELKLQLATIKSKSKAAKTQAETRKYNAQAKEIEQTISDSDSWF